MRRVHGLFFATLATLALSSCTDKVTGVGVVLPAPSSLTSITLSGAIHLDWADNAYQSNPGAFDHYRVYSTSYSIDNNLCGTSWSLEGTNVAPTFLVGALTNGVPRCFAVSAVSTDGTEGDWSPSRNDTPRPDARNLIVYTAPGDPLRNAFRFWLDANSNGRVDSTELGLVGANSASMDFTLVANGPSVVITPSFSGTKVQAFSPIDQLTDIDIAPATGYGSGGLPANVRTGYVFQMDEGDGFFRYGAIKVSAVGPNYIIFDWSYQTDPGNPELLRAVPRIASTR